MTSNANYESRRVFQPVTDHELCHNIAKVAVDPRGDGRLGSADYFDNNMPHRINYKFMCLPAFLTIKVSLLARRISAIIVKQTIDR